MRIDEAAFGPDHPNVARDVNNLVRPRRKLSYNRDLEVDSIAHWILARPIHYQNIENAHRLPMGPVFPYDRVPPHHPLRHGDWVYLLASKREIYGTGTVVDMEPYRDDQFGRDLLRVPVNRLVIPDNNWVSAEEVTRVPTLANVYDEIDDVLIPLRPKQINALNALIRAHRGIPAPDVAEEDESPKFVLNETVMLEETRRVEFKEIQGGSPVHTIRNTVDEYAVAYLNVKTGSLYWGITDDRVVVGVSLNYPKRRRVRAEASVKFGQIQPAVSVMNCSVHFHPVLNDQGEQISDLWVCELNVTVGDRRQLYRTGSGRVFMKTDGGKRNLSQAEIDVELERRRLL